MVVVLLLTMAARALMVNADHVGKAASAAATAVSTSEADDTPTDPI